MDCRRRVSNVSGWTVHLRSSSCTLTARLGTYAMFPLERWRFSCARRTVCGTKSTTTRFTRRVFLKTSTTLRFKMHIFPSCLRKLALSVRILSRASRTVHYSATHVAQAVRQTRCSARYPTRRRDRRLWQCVFVITETTTGEFSG